MKYNHYKERKKFMAEQFALQQQYKEAGMSEEDIREMFIHDLAFFKLSRNEALHTLPLNEEAIEDRSDGIADISQSVSYEYEHSFDWLNEIENEELYNAIIKLPEDWREIIGLLLKGHKQTEIAEKQGLTSANISRKLRKIKNILKNFL